MKLHNTLTRTDSELKKSTKPIRFYTCGLTVYSQPHIGNWVGYIYWDVLERLLIHLGYTVERVQNITDVGHLVSDGDDGEDKLEKGAKKEGITAWKVAEKYTEIAAKEAYDMLGLREPKLIKATDLIEQQIDFVLELEEKGYTYEIDGDGLYFDTSKLSDYGKLAQLDVEGLKAGARVENKNKRNPTDFAVWKFSPKDAKRDMEWESPWGTGFPGWHLECSVIARESLGDQLDIHAGGIDHIPVHHTNEIAQTEAITNQDMSKIWIHNNHIKVNGTKMAKSLGNIYTLSDIESKGFDIVAFKLLILSKHYQTEGNFTWEILEAAQHRLDRWLRLADQRWQVTQLQTNAEHDFDDIQNRFIKALENNLDTPSAVAIVDELMNSIEEQGVTSENLQVFTSMLQLIQQVLGIDLFRDDINDDQKKLLENRAEARESKDWDKSDELRDELAKQGITVKDSNTGQIWSWS